MSTDAELLGHYVRERAEDALAELVRRHANLVYGAALRQLDGDAHRARDVAQTVFSDMIRKAPALAGRTTLAGWLHTSARYAAATARRAARTRERIEREAAEQQALGADAPAIAWERLRPVIDEAIAGLDERERDAVLLRYFEGRPFAEVGAAFGVSPDAARMRVERALEKLRGLLARRGVTSTAVAIGIALENAAATTVVPAGLAGSIVAGAIAPAGVAAIGGGAGIFSFLQPGPAIAVVAAMVAVGAAFLERHRAAGTARQLTAATEERTRAQMRVRELAASVAELTREVGAAQQEAAQRAAAAVPLAGAAAARPAPAEVPPALLAGRAFLAENPEARRLLDVYGRALFERSQGRAALAALNLPPEEYEKVVVAGLKDTRMVMRVGDLLLPYTPATQDDPVASLKTQRGLAVAVEETMTSMLTAAGDRNLSEALGEARKQQLRDYQRGENFRWLVRTVAGATYDSETPLAQAQAGALLEIVRGANGGQEWTAATHQQFNRQAALQQAEKLLTAQQFTAFRIALEKSGYGAPQGATP